MAGPLNIGGEARPDVQAKIIARGFVEVVRRNTSRIGFRSRPEDGCCELCHENFGAALVPDHDHMTNQFRGWICQTCNKALGMLGDNVEGVSRAMVYLTGGARDVN